MPEKLRPEVEPPERQRTGLGVMLIAAAAMFFAVAGSAFILRARMADSCCARSAGPPPAAAEPAETAPPRDCGPPIYEQSQDGSTTVRFDLCGGVE